MLSLTACRAALDEKYSLSDEEIQGIRDQLYDLAAILLDCLTTPENKESDISRHSKANGEASPSCLEEARELAPEMDWQALEERAAIREFEGNQSRDDAERAAISDSFLPKVN